MGSCGSTVEVRVVDQEYLEPRMPRDLIRHEPSPAPSVEFSSEFLNFEVDNRKDQYKIEATEPDYSDAAPPDDVKPTNNWFTDDDFQNGNDEFFEMGSDEYIDIEVPDTTSIVTHGTNTSSKDWKKKPALSFVETDRHAKRARDGVLDSFYSLTEYLKTGIHHVAYEETLLARAIVTWLSNQDVEVRDYGRAGFRSPNELLQSVKEGNMKYATCYTILCRNAGLQCTLIKGVVKAANYEPGDTSVVSNPWTAVHVDGGWQIVNPFWVCRPLYGEMFGAWVKVEGDIKSVLKREKCIKGIRMSTFKEYYFMPKTSEFIYDCYSEQADWQLLPAKETLLSRDEFLQLPYLLPPFFGLGLELISERKCELLSEDGVCKIQLLGQRKNSHMLCLQYELFVKDTRHANNVFLQNNTLPRIVFNSRSGTLFTFEIRFPVEGEFKLVIYGGLHESSKLRLCEFKLKCMQRMQDFKPLAIGDYGIGWGPGPHSEKAGLLVPSKTNGLILVPSPGNRKTVEFKFTLNKLLMDLTEFSGVLVECVSNGKQREYPQSVKYEVDETSRCFIIQVTLPSDGEYALLIKSSVATSNNHQVDRNVVCKYLLTTLVNKPRLKVPHKLAKYKLVEALTFEGKRLVDTIGKVKDALERCKKAGLDLSDDDVYAGETRLGFLNAKNALRDCEMRRHLGVTVRTLERIDRYRNKDALIVETQRVLKVRAELETEIADWRNLHV